MPTEKDWLEFDQWFEANMPITIPTIADALQDFDGSVAFIDGRFYAVRAIKADEDFMSTEVADWRYCGNTIEISTLMYYLLPSAV